MKTFSKLIPNPVEISRDDGTKETKTSALWRFSVKPVFVDSRTNIYTINCKHLVSSNARLGIVTPATSYHFIDPVAWRAITSDLSTSG